jgi:hypothetical protein
MYNALIESFESSNYSVSKGTMNVIKDTLNDFSFSEISYFDEKELHDFKDALKLKNVMTLDLTGENKGECQWTRTYLGNVDAGINEVIELKEQGILKHTILNNSYDTIFDGNEDAVVVVETVSWNSENSREDDKEIYSSSMQLYIYSRQDKS